MARRGIEAATLALPWPSSDDRGRKRSGSDGSVLAVAVVLALIGLVMVYSASAVVAGNRFHDSIYFLKRQGAWLALGFLLLHVASRLDYTVWRQLALPILAVTTVLLIAVLLPPLGVVAKGARRWLRLGPISLQPAEVAKLAVVLIL
ncbi:MAG: FtsW/RodA/SpoVE family cell cycle protein, partial [Nitrospiraceae bacterium]